MVFNKKYTRIIKICTYRFGVTKTSTKLGFINDKTEELGYKFIHNLISLS